MDLARQVYSRDLQTAAMREFEACCSISEVSRRLELSPRTLERRPGVWQTRGELRFPEIGRTRNAGGVGRLARIAELAQKVEQLTVENDLLQALQHFRAFTRRPS